MDEQFKQSITPTAVPDHHYDAGLGEPEDVQRMLMMYTGVIREVKTKLEVLNDELNIKNQRNPIEFIETRVKTPHSIAAKLKRRNLPVTIESAQDNLNDIAGIRVICSFVDDIYDVTEMLVKQDDVRLLEVKDYIKNPKPNGYRSLHIIVEIPVFFSDHKRFLRAEVQVRTIAMDFWASLEHDLRYKRELPSADVIQKELKSCADTIADTDLRMMDLRDRIESMDQEQEQYQERPKGIRDVWHS